MSVIVESRTLAFAGAHRLPFVDKLPISLGGFLVGAFAAGSGNASHPRPVR